MSLDNTTGIVAYALKMAKQYYPQDKYDHAMIVLIQVYVTL